MKLFYAPGTVALAAHITLEEVGADYEAVRLDFANGAQLKPEYLAVNPKGRVPALATERGILTETPAILEYILRLHPQAGLAPLDDAFAWAEAQAFNAYLCSTVHVAHAHKFRGKRWADTEPTLEELKRKVPETMTAAFRMIEDEMFKGPWVLGENFSICDIYMFTIARWLEGDGVNMADIPVTADHRARVMARPATQRAMEAQGLPAS